MIIVQIIDGVSVEALAHFRQFADLAQKYNIKLVVGLVTGWMSGQLFISYNNFKEFFLTFSGH
ncbi:MAG: hypothetical protein GZ094_00010 [Mariniphaga sp.]|nr:hypothetical protein [Mariniphaga sp.]